LLAGALAPEAAAPEAAAGEATAGEAAALAPLERARLPAARADDALLGTADAGPSAAPPADAAPPLAWKAACDASIVWVISSDTCRRCAWARVCAYMTAEFDLIGREFGWWGV
jgi:hypothetical protein